MPRYKLLIEYDGTDFYGWQMQTVLVSVQAVLQQALAQLHGVHIVVHGAGRTDTGVHALGQVAHVDLPKTWDPFELRNAINGNVRPHRVAVIEAEEVSDQFSARFSATKRRYLFQEFRRNNTRHVQVGWSRIPSPRDERRDHDRPLLLRPMAGN